MAGLQRHARTWHGTRSRNPAEASGPRLLAVMVLAFSAGCSEPIEPSLIGGGSRPGADETATGGASTDQALEDCWRQAANTCGACSCTPTGYLTCTPITVPPSCTHGGLSVEAGVSLPSPEDCNTCTCEDVGPCPQDATMECTTHDCTASCTYAGRSYPDGVQFPATDGCNECTCAAGETICGTADCGCDPERETWREYIATTEEACTALDIDCAAGSVQFTNDCGCGCEQSPECPAVAGCERETNYSDDTVQAYTRCESVSVCPLTRIRGIE